jgi:DNA-binding CsgD family transcriptional regulator
MRALRSELIESIYDGALDGSAWAPMLDGICAEVPSSQALMMRAGGAVFEPVAVTGTIDTIANSTVSLFFTEYRSNPWMHGVLASAGRAALLDAHTPLRELEKTGFYADILYPNGMIHGTGITVAADDDQWVNIGLARGRDTGPYQPEEGALLEAYILHLRRALALSARFDAFGQLRRAELSALDRIGTAALLVDRAGGLLTANTAARGLAARGVLVLREGEVPACADRVAAQAFLAGTMAATRGLAPPPLRIHDTAATPLIVVAAPLGEATAMRLAGAGAPRHAAAVLFIHGTRGDAGPAPALLHDLFGLTPAEARVAAEIALGDGEREAARRLGISANTVRTHRQRIFAKIGITRRGELIRLFSALPR